MERAGFECLLSESEVQSKVAELAQQISQDYVGRNLLLLGILNGAALFLADLVRKITIPVEYDFVGFKSYSGSESQGHVEVTKELKSDVAGKNVIIVEDIIDTGRTLHQSGLMQSLARSGVADIKLCSLLDKPASRIHPVEIHYLGFTIENVFVVGYGLDHNGLYRNLPYIGIYRP